MLRAVLLTLTLALFGAPAITDPTADQLKLGKGAYDFLCMKCHGKDLVNPGTASFDLRKFPQDDPQRFFDSVLNGKGNMPAWADLLEPGELEAMWIYVATRAGTVPLPPEAELKTEDEKGAQLAPPSTLQDAVPTILPTTLQSGALTACMARNNGALSGMRSSGGSGFDYRVALALAEGMGLSLDVIWFEAEQDEESDPVREAYAMLSYGLCDVVPSHPLYARAVGAPPSERAALPRWRDMPTTVDLRQQVLLSDVSVSAPYMRASLGLVYRDGDAAPQGLGDLGGRVLGYQQGTLSGALVEYQAAPEVRASARTFNPGPNFLWEIEKGAAEVAFVDVVAFDAHRKQNSLTALRLSDWRHRLGFDIGFAIRSDNPTLKSALDAGLADLEATGALAQMADEEGLTWQAPAHTGIAPPLTRAALLPGH